jgi:chemotaxis protein methyltransferase CheR
MSSITAAASEYVRTLVLERSAIVLDEGKDYLIEARLGPIAREVGLASVDELVAKVRANDDRAMTTQIVEAMATHETSFFRDATPFEVLASVVLPDLIEKRRTTRRLSIWSAACSTGQEPYTIAMVILDRFPELRDWSIEILATDLSEETLSYARTGTYSSLEVNRGMPARMLMANFTKRGTKYQLSDEIRRMVIFRQLNLAESWSNMPICDLVFIRNVLIYFDVPTKRRILGNVRGVLRPPGYLFLGGAETTVNLDESFIRVPAERGCCYRLAEQDGA